MLTLDLAIVCVCVGVAVRPFTYPTLQDSLKPMRHRIQHMIKLLANFIRNLLPLLFSRVEILSTQTQMEIVLVPYSFFKPTME